MAGTNLTVKKTDNPDTTPPAPVKSAAERAAEKHARLKAMIEGAGDLPLEDRIKLACQQVHDPEIPVNIYELGLIYDIEISPGKDVKITMTLTSPACPVAGELPLEVQRNVAKIPEVRNVEVDLTFDPPWGPERMSDVAKVTLGMM
jgi:FeS assembly SUF system protein